MNATPPIELAGTADHRADHLAGSGVALDPAFLAELAGVCETATDVDATAEVSRDWWPLTMHWALAGEVPRRAGVVARPTTTEQVAAVATLCNTAHVPLTVAGGRSGVCGASLPVFGGVVLDITAMQGAVSVDEVSGIVEVLAGTFGPDLEAVLVADHGLSVGHFPQSFDIATVGGWVACRGAGQYSTRYGKIDEMVVGLEVVLADGRVITTGGSPAASVGPDLDELFLGSEGTLGIITRVWLRAHPTPAAERRAAYSFPDITAGFEACRRIIRRGATPAVLRLYDAEESKRGQAGDGTECILLVLDEGDPLLIDAVMAIVAEVAVDLGATDVGPDRVEAWMHHRNDTSALQALTRKGFVVDTMEIAAPWSALGDVFTAVRAAMLAVPHARTATCHLSHSYVDGACLYFTFAATPAPDEVEATYVALWDAGQRSVLRHGGNLSHHHGVGLNRGRFMAEALGPAHEVLASLKAALDPHGILNPGKLGLDSPFGRVAWPTDPGKPA
ncbi:MAG: FAD/FMN-dependent dehydrogenase [Ilumatobacteraceae bacterium]|nr:FAD/FMN-dependent dehydrogenase [Ilumatobacteraceae bacterium]